MGRTTCAGREVQQPVRWKNDCEQMGGAIWVQVDGKQPVQEKKIVLLHLEQVGANFLHLVWCAFVAGQPVARKFTNLGGDSVLVSPAWAEGLAKGRKN
eukprot:2870807-Amphidinium_carterae.1